MSQETPSTVDETLNRLKANLPSMPKRMRQCGEYIWEHHNQIAFSTVAEIAEKANVQPSAMIRFCNLLGFKGYSEMQKLFRQEISRAPPDYATRIENLRAKGDLSSANLLAEFVEAGRFSLEKLTHEISEENLDAATRLMSNAKIIHIVGYRRAFPVANCLSYTLEKLEIPNVSHDDVGKVSKYKSITKDDVVIAITFKPYTAGTVELVEYAIQAGASVIAITDSEISPVNMEGVCLLKVVDIDVGDFRSLSASINLAMVLAVSAGRLL